MFDLADIKNKLIEERTKGNFYKKTEFFISKNKGYLQIRLYDSNRGKSLPSNIHFEILKAKDNKFRLEIHFEEDDTTRFCKNEELKKLIENSDFECFSWWKGKKVKRNPNNQSIRYKKLIELKKEEDLNKFIQLIIDTWNKFHDVLVKIYKQKNDEEKTEEQKKGQNMDKNSLNQILYGPPGAGKTYNTINEALKIIFEKENEEKVIEYEFQDYKLNEKVAVLKAILEKKQKEQNFTDEERKKLKTAFEYYKNQGQIEFVTFHQSYGYEEFVEGIKAIPAGEQGNEYGKEMIYKVVDGIFKKICKKAELSELFCRI